MEPIKCIIAFIPHEGTVRRSNNQNHITACLNLISRRWTTAGSRPIESPSCLMPSAKPQALDEIQAKLNRSRQALLQVTEHAGEDVLVRKFYPHPVFGMMDGKRWLDFVGITNGGTWRSSKNWKHWPVTCSSLNSHFSPQEQEITVNRASLALHFAQFANHNSEPISPFRTKLSQFKAPPPSATNSSSAQITFPKRYSRIGHCQFLHIS
ncbi:hypothetical protein [Paenibacillus sacheonensis]|uniref:Uncharacterized protein n=1 Tax=Paenibacillus sacheonensis TaxID=742054 RepID=A0A7X4YL38_9BACL|nr:hypothetical protein [Paenibacillus sacheonensis]MBM7568806.1 hypothetical protein [Paenibacillus sacheonensis]NBC68363.1 hypothetical protein [Paenibacillus sacheonensis]